MLTSTDNSGGQGARQHLALRVLDHVLELQREVAAPHLHLRPPASRQTPWPLCAAPHLACAEPTARERTHTARLRGAARLVCKAPPPISVLYKQDHESGGAPTCPTYTRSPTCTIGSARPSLHLPSASVAPVTHTLCPACPPHARTLSDPRTKWTRRVPHPVLIGHAASLPGRGAPTDRGPPPPRGV
jgi:hypothetical protein